VKVIIAGSRAIYDSALIERAVADSGFNITTVVCGDAHGADRLGDEWAKARNIEVLHFPAEWHKYGKSAGYKRNLLMGEAADAAVVVRKGMSKGSTHMVQIMRRMGKPVFVQDIP